MVRHVQLAALDFGKPYAVHVHNALGAQLPAARHERLEILW
jgi:hypothetical protein